MTFDPGELERSGRDGVEGVVFRDKRRIDPVTGAVRQPQDTAAPISEPAPADESVDEPAASPAVSASEAALAERTADLQRLQAEYVNYKRRVDRDRQAVRESAVASVLTGLLPVLDDIGRAREHGEVTGGFKAVADSLERTLQGLGLESFAEAGEPFDPRVHEALMHSYSDEVSEPVCQLVLQVGYRRGDRVLRPARVAVVEPETPTAPAEGPVDGSATDEPQPAYDDEGDGSDGTREV